MAVEVNGTPEAIKEMSSKELTCWSICKRSFPSENLAFTKFTMPLNRININSLNCFTLCFKIKLLKTYQYNCYLQYSTLKLLFLFFLICVCTMQKSSWVKRRHFTVLVHTGLDYKLLKNIVNFLQD